MERHPGLMLAALVLALLLAPGVAGAACPAAPAGASTVREGAVQVAWWTEPAAIAVGRPFVLQLQLCPADAQLLRVDATMPEHRHGMNYRPSLQALGGGRWRAEGLLWHMAGRWELRLDVRAGGAEQRLLHSVTLP
jgi:hypothetical protein